MLELDVRRGSAIIATGASQSKIDFAQGGASCGCCRDEQLSDPAGTVI